MKGAPASLASRREISVLPTPVGPIIRMFFGITSSRSLSLSCSRRQRLRSAIATARLASAWPMMKRSSSETISRGEKSVIGVTFYLCGGNSRQRGRLLPGLDGFGRVDKHQNIQQKIVPDEIYQRGLDQDAAGDNAPDRQPPCQREAGHHGKRVGNGVDDAVAVIVERDRASPIAFDHEARILQDLPGSFAQDRQREPRRNARAWQGEPGEKV